MPSWCENNVTITGEVEHVENFGHFVKGKELVFDFEKVIPMPEELKGTRSPMTIVKTQAEVDKLQKDLEEQKKNDKDGWLRSTKTVAMTEKKVKELGEKYGYIEEPTWDNDMNFTGYKKKPIIEWHRFSNHYWGTKWNACDTEMPNYTKHENGKAILDYRFNTAWSPPVGIFLALSHIFKEVHISWWWGGIEMEGEGFLEQEYPFEGN